MMRVIDTWAQATPTTRARMRAFIIVFSSSGTGCYQASLYSQGLGEVGRAEVVQTSRWHWDGMRSRGIPECSRSFHELPLWILWGQGFSRIFQNVSRTLGECFSGLRIFQNFMEFFFRTFQNVLRTFSRIPAECLRGSQNLLKRSRIHSEFSRMLSEIFPECFQNVLGIFPEHQVGIIGVLEMFQKQW